MPDSYAESADGVILVANGIDPVVKWDGFTDQAEPAGVEPPDPTVIPELAPGGSFFDVLNGTYQIYVRFVDRDGNVSNLSAPSQVVTVTRRTTLDYSNLPIPQQTKVVRRQILRNTDGQFDTFYVDVDSTDIFSSTASSGKTDAELSAGEAVPLLDATTGFPFANRYTVPPATKPFLATHIGRMWYMGEQTYSEGSVSVTRGSKTVTGIGTQWASTFPDRFLYVQGATQGYEIDTVDPIAQTIQLIDSYADDDQQFAEYTIKPSPGEAASVYFSEAGLPEAVPVFNAFTMPEDGDEVTGGMQFSSFLYIFKRRRMYRFTGQSDPSTDGFLFYALGRGCINNRCWVIVEEQAYLMDEAGIYRAGGGDSAEQLSTPIQDLFRRGETGAINWAASRYFHCSYHPAGETIRWFVTLNGEYLPRHALALHYKTGKWWVERWPVPIASSRRGRAGRPTGAWADAGEQVFLGGPAGEIYQLGGTLDGVPAIGPTNRGRVTSATITTLTDAAAAFDTSVVNVPVVIVSGRGAGQQRLVTDATATTLTLASPWRVKPDATSVYQLGGIPFKYRSVRMRYARSDEALQGVSVEIQFEPTEAPQTFDLRTYGDFSAKPMRFGRDMGKGQKPGVTVAKDATEAVVQMDTQVGHYWHRMDRKREQSTDAPRLVRVELGGVSGPEQTRFGEALLNGILD